MDGKVDCDKQGYLITDMNRILKDKGKVGQVAPMERGVWYTLNLSIATIN